MAHGADADEGSQSLTLLSLALADVGKASPFDQGSVSRHDRPASVTVDRRKPQPRPNRGAVRCWCSPARGWSYIITEGERSVTVLDAWAGGTPVERAIPLVKISERMTSAQVTAARKSGRLQDTEDGIGFTLTPEQGNAN